MKETDTLCHMNRILILFALMLPLPTWAQDALTPLINSFEAGVVCAPNVVSTREAPNTVAGETYVVEEVPPFVSHERLVPAVLGVGFAVRASSKDPFGLPGVEMRVTHPPMGADGVTEQRFFSFVGSPTDPSYTSYTFDHDYELVTGDWAFAAYLGDTLLYRVSYTVVSPDLLPDLAAECGYTDLLG